MYCIYLLCPARQTLDFSDCVIEHIDRKAFGNLGNSIETILLKGNRLRSIQVSGKKYWISTISHRQLGRGTSILLKRFSSHRLKHLTVSVSSIPCIESGVGTLATCSLFQEDIFLSTTNIKSLELHQNPWRCDCHLKQFR